MTTKPRFAKMREDLLNDDDTHPGEQPMKPGAIWSPVPTAAKLADTGENC